MYKVLILSLIFIISSFPQSLKSKIDKILKDELFETCLVAIQVEDLTTNKTLYKKNEKLLLRPASNMKIITSAAGLLYLGPDYEFSTDLYYDGYTSNDTLYGNIYVVGGCDPDFTTGDLYKFVDAIKNQNISFINGNIYGDISFKDSLYWGKGWMWDDDPSSDAPYLSALNINDNCVVVDYFAKNDSIVINPRTSFVTVTRAKSDEKFTIDRNWIERNNQIIISGKNDKKDYSVKVNILNPELYFLKVFSEVLDSNQVKVIGGSSVKKLSDSSNYLTSVLRKYSDVIVNLNKESDNLSAEMTLYALAEKFFGKPANAKNGIKLIQKMIDDIGLKSEQYRFVDGSGVSHYNVVTAELLVSILKYFYEQKTELFSILNHSFPIGAVDGTLEYRMNNKLVKENVHAKTGTLTGVTSLSGYVTNSKKHLIAFSIIMQNYVGSSSKAKDYEDEICKILSE